MHLHEHHHPEQQSCACSGSLLYELTGRVFLLDRKLDQILTTQDDINVAVAAIGEAVATLTTETAELGTSTDAIVAWIAAHPEVDTSGLTEAVAGLTASADAIKAAADAAEAATPATPEV